MKISQQRFLRSRIPSSEATQDSSIMNMTCDFSKQPLPKLTDARCTMHDAPYFWNQEVRTMTVPDPLSEGIADVDPAPATTMKTNLGIDLNSAMEILSQRSFVIPQNRTTENESPNDSDIDTLQHNLNGLSSKVACGCCPVVRGLDSFSDSGTAMTEGHRPTGQLIDIGKTSLNDDSKDTEGDKNQTKGLNSAIHNDAKATDILDKQERLKVAQQQAVARQEELASMIQSLTINDTVSAILNTQEERVKCYRFFDEVLEYVLDTGNTEYYPLVCADVTATFTVLSSTINAIRRDLCLRTVQSAIEIVELINRLQSAEQSKLQLTAALHLERIRSQAIQRETSAMSNVQKNIEDTDQIGIGNEAQLLDTDSQTATEQEDRIALLLEESVQTLRKKIASTIVEINDVLEELRYTVVDSNDDE